MTSIQLTFYAIIGLCLLLFFVSFGEQFKAFFNFVLRATMGILTFTAMNIVFGSSSFFIASNIFTVMIAGFLGFYGIIALIISNIIL